jgi:hypothetical protein
MLLRRSTIVVVLLVLLAGIAAASVSAASAGSGPNLNNLKSGNGGYIVTQGGKSPSAMQSLTAQPMVSPIYGSIVQSQTEWAQITITGYTTSFCAELYWGNPSNSLSLTAYTPDGYVLGPYYNMGNGNIDITISRSSGVTDGTYYFKIYGNQVVGSQSYTFS